ncbi:unnamed protein product [Camellia sinensis]
MTNLSSLLSQNGKTRLVPEQTSKFNWGHGHGIQFQVKSFEWVQDLQSPTPSPGHELVVIHGHEEVHNRH